MRTVFGLPQFDSLGHQTMLLLRVVEGLDEGSAGRSVLVLNPGQGHVRCSWQRRWHRAL